MKKLTDADKKYWAPDARVIHHVTSLINPSDHVLEVGPGRPGFHTQFTRANVSVDQMDIEGIPNLVKCDLANDTLPFSDNEFDFVYCRHVIEDMFNPFGLLNEMQRVGKRGYVETPSPMAELCRGVDGRSPGYRGYHHHRYIVWLHGSELRLMAKYPIVEYLDFKDEYLVDLLRKGARYWNTYLLWENTIDWKHRQNAVDYDMLRDYPRILPAAIEQSVASCDAFWQNVPEKLEITVPLPQAYAAL